MAFVQIFIADAAFSFFFSLAGKKKDPVANRRNSLHVGSSTVRLAGARLSGHETSVSHWNNKLKVRKCPNTVQSNSGARRAKFVNLRLSVCTCTKNKLETKALLQSNTINGAIVKWQHRSYLVDRSSCIPTLL